ncbi:MAG: TolC family protein [Bacteroidaceae bacterium]|nr:TolC family protein [Bacteroidaceae bacterium]
MRKSKNYLAWALILMLSGTVCAQEKLDLTLDKALEIALSDNPTIKVADQEIVLKKVANKEAWMNLLPELSVGGSWQYTIKVPVMVLGGQKFQLGDNDVSTVAGTATLSLPIFAPAVYKSMSLTKTDIQLAQEKARASRLDLINQVTKAYYLLMLTQDSYEVLQKSYELAEENFNVVNSRYEQGLVSEYDKISAEVQMRNVKPSVVSAENGVRLAKLQLKVLMGITEDIDLIVKEKLNNYETLVFTNQLDNENKGLENNSTMRQFDLNANLLKKNVGLAWSNFMPTLGVALTGQYQSMYNNNWNVFNYSWIGSSQLTFSLSIPIFRASNFTKLKTARLQRTQLELNRIDTERKLNMQVTSYKNNMAASSEQVLSNKEAVNQANKALSISKKRYEVGKGTVLELNSSQVSLTQSELTYSQSIYDYLTAKADLDLVLGRENN